MSTPPAVTRVADWLSISEQMALYCELVDTNDLERLVDEVLAPDSSMGFGYEDTWLGAEQIRDRLQEIRDTFEATAHAVGNVQIRFTGDGEARATSMVHGWHWVAAAGTGAARNADYLAVAIYHDRWERREGRWLLAHREVKSILPQGQGFMTVGVLPAQFVDLGT